MALVSVSCAKASAHVDAEWAKSQIYDFSTLRIPTPLYITLQSRFLDHCALVT
jgi:hypothetical protein